MKLLIVAFLIVAAGAASAQDMIKTYDGSIARCENKTDVFNYQFSGIYRPIKLKRFKDKADFQVEFLKCVEDKAEYKFVRDTNFESRTVNVEGIEYKITRKEVVIFAYNGSGELVDRKPLIRNKDHVYSASLNTIAIKYDDLPPGKKSLEVAIQSVFELNEVESGKNIDRGHETLGSYRLILK